MTTQAHQYFQDKCSHSIRDSEYRLIANPHVEVLIDTLTHNTICMFADASAILINWDHTKLTVVDSWSAGGRVILERVA